MIATPRRITSPAALFAVLALAACALSVPSSGSASVTYSYAEMAVEGLVKAKTFKISIDAVHDEDRSDQVGYLSPPEDPSVDRGFSGRVNVCVIATSFVQKGRTREQIREQACYRTIRGYRFDPEAMEASIAGKVRTDLWTRTWKVIGGRWAIVSDRTVPSSAKIDVTWRWVQTPVYYFVLPCGGVYSSAAGLWGPARADGTITFKGSGITAKIAGRGGELFAGECADPV